MDTIKYQEENVFDETENGLNKSGFRTSYELKNIDKKKCFDVINDVEKYTSFLKIYEKVTVISDIIEQNKRIRIARYDINIPFILRFFFKDLYYVLKLTNICQDDTNTMIWEQVEGPSFLLENTGIWTVKQIDNNVIINLETSMIYNFYLPDYIKKYITSHILNESMNNIKQRILFLYNQ